MRLEPLLQTPLPWATPTPVSINPPPFFEGAMFADGAAWYVDVTENAVQFYNTIGQGGLTDTIMTAVLVLLVLGGLYLIYRMIANLDSDNE